MKQLLSHRSESVSRTLSARSAWPAGMAALLAAGSLACSEAALPNTPMTTAGAGGQVTAGSGGSGVVAGTSSTPTGGTPAASGAGGTPGSGGGGGAGGNSAGAGNGGAAGSAGTAGSGGASDGGWVPLFNGTNLDGWTPSAGHAGLFAAGMLEGEPVIHVYPAANLQDGAQGVAQATLRTNESYSKYVFHLEYKWGVKRFNDRQGARDNGICFHVCNEPSMVWPHSVELQIGSDAWGNDWVTGNIFMLVDKTRAKWTSATLNGKDAFSETGQEKTIGAPQSYYRGLSSAQLDKPDDWNVIELTVNGAADAEYKVNGMVVNRVFDMECDEGEGFKPLESGPIALQAEFAETYFRNVKIKVLP